MDLLEKELGKRCTPKEIASWLGIDPQTVKKYHAALGGIRLGPRKIIFFEKEVLNAIQKIREAQESLDRTDQKDGDETLDQGFQNQTRSAGMGGRNSKAGYLIDGHRLFG